MIFILQILFILTLVISVIIIVWYFFIKLLNKKKPYINECRDIPAVLEGVTLGLFLNYISSYEKETLNKPFKTGLNNPKFLMLTSILVVSTIFFLILLSWSICHNMIIGPVISNYSSSKLFSNGFILLSAQNEIEPILTFTDYIPSLSTWQWIGITLGVTVSSVVLFTGYVAYNLTVGPVLPDSFNALWSSGIVFDNNLAEASSVVNSLLDSVVDQVEASSVVDSLLDSVVDQVEASSVINSLLDSVVDNAVAGPSSVIDNVPSPSSVVSTMVEAIISSDLPTQSINSVCLISQLACPIIVISELAGTSSVVDTVADSSSVVDTVADSSSAICAMVEANLGPQIAGPSSVVDTVADSSSVVSTMVEADLFGVNSIMDQVEEEWNFTMFDALDYYLTTVNLPEDVLYTVHFYKHESLEEFETPELYVLWCANNM